MRFCLCSSSSSSFSFFLSLLDLCLQIMRVTYKDTVDQKFSRSFTGICIAKINKGLGSKFQFVDDTFVFPSMR